MQCRRPGVIPGMLTLTLGPPESPGKKGVIVLVTGTSPPPLRRPCSLAGRRRDKASLATSYSFSSSRGFGSSCEPQPPPTACWSSLAGRLPWWIKHICVA